VRKDHPLRTVRAMTDEILNSMSPLFDAMYAEEAEADRRVLRLAERHRSVAQAEASWTLQSGMDFHLRGGGL